MSFYIGRRRVGRNRDKNTKTKAELFNERAQLRKDKAKERLRQFEEARKPDPAIKSDGPDNRPPAPPVPPAPKKPKEETANRPGKAERQRRGGGRSSDRRF
jgi:hypothetical protein